ncbi:PREDICTED: uncharacterized protein LOC105456626 isoform X2 [Wasmannia auropunctata]|uniref:uncharacterized protein LOC105456626 isoform X2 n=1 Tax=Wasmannia auropunctata TaxID=64793 RepID=UPI0005EEF935|nr:PREDICTED: uncharacterized protein LOC105456626 isoform X2 [Wasmannia auropunctata]
MREEKMTKVMKKRNLKTKKIMICKELKVNENQRICNENEQLNIRDESNHREDENADIENKGLSWHNRTNMRDAVITSSPLNASLCIKSHNFNFTSVNDPMSESEFERSSSESSSYITAEKGKTRHIIPETDVESEDLNIPEHQPSFEYEECLGCSVQNTSTKNGIEQINEEIILKKDSVDKSLEFDSSISVIITPKNISEESEYFECLLDDNIPWQDGWAGTSNPGIFEREISNEDSMSNIQGLALPNLANIDKCNTTIKAESFMSDIEHYYEPSKKMCQKEISLINGTASDDRSTSFTINSVSSDDEKTNTRQKAQISAIRGPGEERESARAWNLSEENENENEIVTVWLNINQEEKSNICAKVLMKEINKTLDEITKPKRQLFKLYRTQISVWIHLVQRITEFCNSLPICVEITHYLIVKLKSVQSLLTKRNFQNCNYIWLQQLRLVFYALNIILQKYRKLGRTCLDLDARSRCWVNVLDNSSALFMDFGLAEFAQKSISLIDVLIL